MVLNGNWSNSSTWTVCGSAIGDPLHRYSRFDDDFVKLMNGKAGGIPMYLSSMASWLKEKKMVEKDDDGGGKRNLYVSIKSEEKYGGNVVVHEQ